MFTPSIKDGLQRDLTQLQNRIASALRGEFREHEVLISVSVSDNAGNVYETIAPTGPTSNRAVGAMSDISRFATGIPQSTTRRRVAAVAEIAAVVFALAGNDAYVVSATYQDTDFGGFGGDKRTINHVAQCFVKDDKLQIREVTVDDRS